MFLVIELCLTAACLALAYVYPQCGDGWFSRAEQGSAAFAERRLLSAISLGLLALGLRLALLPILPVPQPGVHDEFSHLLLADTLAHGRLANPTHPMWVHFETFHVNWKPTYTSMYFPGQGLFLAVGQVVFGHPFWGVWLSTGLMSAAICWALQAWLSPQWALLGGFLAVLRLETFSYWANGYWGGAVPALAGAMVLGTLPRIRRERKVRHAVLLGVGTVSLLITRPYESLFFLFPVLTMLLVWTLREKNTPLPSAWVRIALPAGAIVLAGLTALAFYFWKVTGSPWTSPYKLNIQTYGLLYFPWDKIRAVGYHHAALEEFYRGGAVVGMYHFARQHPIELLLTKALTVWLFYFGPIFTLPVVAGLVVRGRLRLSSDAKLLAALSATPMLGLALIIHVGHPHYIALLTTAFYALVLLCMRSLRNWRWHGRPSGIFLVRAVPLVCGVMFLVRAAAPLAHIAIVPSGIRTWCSMDRQNLERACVVKQLENSLGDHLVIVRYKPEHDFINDEWVFNAADINGSKVIWARDMGTTNAELIQYFSARKVWLMEPDYNPPRLTPYAR